MIRIITLEDIPNVEAEAIAYIDTNLLINRRHLLKEINCNIPTNGIFNEVIRFITTNTNKKMITYVYNVANLSSRVKYVLFIPYIDLDNINMEDIEITFSELKDVLDSFNINKVMIPTTSYDLIFESMISKTLGNKTVYVLKVD